LAPEFNYERLLIMIIEKSLMEQGKQHERLLLSLDGTRKGLRTMVFAGFKFAVHVKGRKKIQPTETEQAQAAAEGGVAAGGEGPMEEEHNDEEEEEKKEKETAETSHISHQSSRGCLPAALFCGKDNNQNAKLFLGDFFVWAETLRKTGYWYRGLHYTIDLLIPADLKAGWQATGRGGGSASTNEFCFLCTETRGEKGSLHLACDDCRTRHGREQCRHRSFIISRDELEGQDIQGVQVFCPWSIPTLPEPRKAGLVECNAFLQSVGESTTGDKIKLQRETKRWLEEKLVVAVGDEKNLNHLARASRQLLETNLQLRFPTEELTALCEDLVASQTRLSVDDDGHEVTETEAMRSLLAKCLKTEEVIKLYTTRVGTKSITAFIAVSWWIFCTASWRWDLNGKEKKELISKNETITNERIFCSQGAGMGNYKITVEKGAVQTMSMNNDRLRKVFANISLLIEANLGANGAAFANLFSLYMRFMTRLQSDIEYSDEEIEVASDAMTDFGECWISLFGTDSITNYVHYIIAGHVALFLMKYRNLAIFANQGWEAMNGVMKKYLGRRT
jgi:hypothetical protein